MSALQTSTQERRQRMLVILASSTTLLVAACSALYRIRTFDTFFHLATGRLILETGKVPDVDPFSFTVRGAPWLNHSWGFQVLIAKLHALGGFELLSIYQALTASLLASVLLFQVRRAPPLWAAAGLFCVLPMTAFREVLEVRPHVLGFLCLSVTLLIALETMRERKLWALGLLPPTYALWATVHGSHVLMYGVLLLGITTLVGRKDFRAAGAFTACTVVVLALGLWLAPKAFSQGGQHVASTFLESSVREWYPVTFPDLMAFWPGRAFLLCWLMGLVGAVVAHTEIEGSKQAGLPRGPFPLILLAAFMLIAFTSRRMLALYALGAAPLWVPYAALVWTRLIAVRWPRFVDTASILVLFGLLTLVLLPNQTFQSGLGLAPVRMPEEAVDVMRTAGRIKRVYNAYNFGGYLMWERTPAEGVFVDGRAITVYPSEFLDTFERAYDDPAQFEALVATYRCDGVLMPVESARAARLRRYLAKSPRWRLSHRDRVAEVYEPVASFKPL